MLNIKNLCEITLLLVFVFLINTTAHSKIKIKYKIGNEIITNVDIQNERSYLIFLRPELSKLPEKEIKKISENSLIREIIKKKELEIAFGKFQNKKFNDDIKKNLFRFKKVKNEKEFIELIKKNDIEYEKIINKLRLEALWNDLIYRKYNLLVKIDKEKMRKELLIKISNNKKFEYNLSELLYEVDPSETQNSKYSKILKYVDLNDFKAAASKFSIADSRVRGGEIGWVKETLLSKNLNNLLKKMKKNQISSSIKYPNGYLILKINDKRELKEKINIDKELFEAINFERNKQLNQFSILYYKKLEQNTVIDEV